MIENKGNLIKRHMFDVIHELLDAIHINVLWLEFVILAEKQWTSTTKNVME